MSQNKPYFIPDEQEGIESASLELDSQSFLLDPKHTSVPETTDAVVASFTKKVKAIRSKTKNLQTSKITAHFTPNPILQEIQEEKDTK